MRTSPLHFAVLSAALLSAACAQNVAVDDATDGWNATPNDERLSAAKLADLVAGRELIYVDGSRSLVEADGDYTFIWTDDTEYAWTWEATADGAICLENEAGRTRCDLIVRNGDALISINEQGGRFEIVEINAL